MDGRLICLSVRGDKDVHEVARLLEKEICVSFRSRLRGRGNYGQILADHETKPCRNLDDVRLEILVV